MAANVRSLAPTSERIELDRCCAAAGVELREAPLGIDGREALIAPVAGHLRIVINSDPLAAIASPALRRHRRRFRIAHELGHTFFYTRTARSTIRRYPPGSRWEEAFCDEFARRLLVSPPVGCVSATELLDLQVRYDVSLEVAARSLASAPTRPRVALWWWTKDGSSMIRQQWVSDAGFAEQLGVRPRETSPDALPAILGDAHARLGDALTSAVLPDRRQAVAVFATPD